MSYDWKNIQYKNNKSKKTKKEGKTQKTILLPAYNRIINNYISKPRVIRKIFYLKTTIENFKEQLKWV